MIRVSTESVKPVKIWASILEPDALAQAHGLASLPFIESHVALMPDAHVGKGSTVGTVIATRGAVIPAAVGVDIGCGMSAARLPFSIDRLEGKLPALRSRIEERVPTGFHANDKPDAQAEQFFASTLSITGNLAPDLCTKALLQCGSLGGGNHFIEVCHDEENYTWIMLHSGSRNVGKTLAERHIAAAKGLMKQYFIDLPDPDLAYLAQGTREFAEYMAHLNWAQMYAAINRRIMRERILAEVWRIYGGRDPGHAASVPWIDCHHNYTTLENHHGKNIYVTRKGAVSAREGQLGIIPGSMGTKGFIVRGKGNSESFNSCSHGAGRSMSRAQARRKFNIADLYAQTKGVECRKDADVIDEIPESYKPIDQVMADQADLVDIVHTLKQVLCVKGA